MTSMYITEISATTSDGKTRIYDGVLIKANSVREAQETAFKMNKDLKVVGEYVSQVEFVYELGF
tara:strand:- start:6593 stop:6784 length:192 start_codon:yes stop_codon:yes gene_type:complete